MHFERFKVHSRAQSASTNRTGFGVLLWYSSCLGQSTGEMPARHLSLSLSHSRSLPPSLPPSLSPPPSLSASRERLRETHSMRDPLHFYEHISRNREATCAVQVAPSTAPCWGDSYPK